MLAHMATGYMSHKALNVVEWQASHDQQHYLCRVHNLCNNYFTSIFMFITCILIN